MLPSTKTCLPLARYCPQVSPCFPQTMILCHSVLSCRLPSASVHTSDVAMGKRATARPVEVKRTSGSFPRLPIKIALFTDIRASWRSQIDRKSNATLSPVYSLVNNEVLRLKRRQNHASFRGSGTKDVARPTSLHCF